MEQGCHALTWFEIPVTDIDRATRFYETLLNKQLRREFMGGIALGVFPHDENSGVGGCLQAGPGLAPAGTGTIVYLDAGPSIDTVLKRVGVSGGKIALDKTALPPGMGYFAHIIDSEGNRVGVHALN